MKQLAMIMFVVAIGCGGGKKDESTMTSAPSTGTDPNTPVASSGGIGGVGCEKEILRQCADGMVDGCTKGLTTTHECVPAAEVAGPPCAQEIAKVCPDGQVDACLTTPVAATNHICVAK